MTSSKVQEYKERSLAHTERWLDTKKDVTYSVARGECQTTVEESNFAPGQASFHHPAPGTSPFLPSHEENGSQVQWSSSSMVSIECMLLC